MTSDVEVNKIVGQKQSHYILLFPQKSGSRLKGKKVFLFLINMDTGVQKVIKFD